MKGREYSSEKYKKSENTVDTKEATIERRDSPGWFILVLYAIAGIVISSGGFYLYTHQTPTPLDPILALGAILLSVFVGISATIYPALKASRIDPSDALRYI